ncbi:FxDxF family PEP-CTERM protein [Rugamonas sp. CCM 8940]|nr:FxDxF family PEP-CTERM protein [Rugamonas sp. CCM 8940]
MKKFSLSAISLAAVLCAGSVQAAPGSVTSSVTVSNFHYTLIDLDTNDNIAPSIHFNFPDPTDSWKRRGSNVRVYSAVLADGENSINRSASERNAKVVDMSQSTSLLGMVNSSGTITTGGGEFGMQGASSVIQGAAVIPVDSAFQGTNYYSAEGGIFKDAPFTLSAHTKLEFSFDILVSASVFANKNQNARSETRFESYLGYIDALGENRYGSEVRAIYLGSAWGSAESINETLSMSVSNTTDNDLAGDFALSSNMWGQVTAVPEPETYAMLLAGLGLLGFMAKRRRA